MLHLNVRNWTLNSSRNQFLRVTASIGDKFQNAKSPWDSPDSLGRIEVALQSEEIAETVFSDYQFSKTNSDEALIMQLFKYWINLYGMDLTDEKQLNCFRVKCWEYRWVKESRAWPLAGRRFEFNWHSPYDHDVWMVSDKYQWLPCEVKRQTNTFAPKANEWGISAHNFLTVRLSQLQRYCTEGLELIVIDRDVCMSKPNNARVKKFVRIHGVDDGRELESSRMLCFIDLKRLCEMYVKKQRLIELKIPYEKRHESEKHDGRTLAFSANDFPSILLT